jgi:endonuclease/exonuclease/phosphatase (EEP) superfamily protein YafD
MLRQWLDRSALVLGWLYPASLVVITLLFAYVGERWWATGVLLYLPRAAWGAPLPFLLALLVAFRRFRLVGLQLVSACIVLFPLMGFVLPGFHDAANVTPKIRVLTYNVDSANAGPATVLTEVDRHTPDLVFLQEASGSLDELVRLLKARYPVVTASTQFVVASRFPLVSTFEPEHIPFEGKERSPRWLSYVIDTPLGKVAFYNLHPISPREGFVALRGHGARYEILSGRLFLATRAAELRSINGLRELQVADASAHAHRETSPVVLVGDTNLTGLSPVLRRYLGDYQDGFASASWGLGYTFPVGKHWPWMRLDRIFASDGLAFVHFEVGTSRSSDHKCVVADLVRAGG